MIRVTVELISAVDPSRSKILGVAEIANDGTGGITQGNYRVKLSKRAPMHGQVWKTGTVEGFPRKRLGGWDLLYRALRNIVASRND